VAEGLFFRGRLVIQRLRPVFFVSSSSSSASSSSFSSSSSDRHPRRPRERVELEDMAMTSVGATLRATELIALVDIELVDFDFGIAFGAGGRGSPIIESMAG
jgi:hypothetical protein